jgi:hypothetical protein
MAASVVYLVQCVVTHFMAQKYYRIEYEWKKIGMMTLSAVVLFFLIDRFSIKGYLGDYWLNDHVLPFLTYALRLLHFNVIKGGKLMVLLSDKFPIVVEGMIKAVLSLSFVWGLALFGVIPRRVFSEVMNKSAQRLGLRRFTQSLAE